MTNSLAQRVRALPLVVKLALASGAVFAIYLLVVEKELDAISTYGFASADNESALRDYTRDADAVRKAKEVVANGVQQFGNVALPGDPQTRPSEFNSVVDAVLEKYGVTDVNSTSKTTTLPIGPLTRFLGSGQSAERVQKDLTFSATPEAFHAVLADLERAPEVATITRLTVRQGDDREKADRILKVTMALETWTISKKERQ